MHPVVKSFMDLFKRREEAKKSTSIVRIAAISIPAGPIQLPLFRRRGVELAKRRVRMLRLRNARRFRLQSEPMRPGIRRLRDGAVLEVRGLERQAA